MIADATILEAWDHPALFAPHFRSDDTWNAWRAFCAAMFALPPTDAMLALYREHTGRETWPAKPFSEAALVVGRRGGKSRILALLGTFLATFRDYSSHLAPGEVATIAIIAADRKQARAIFRFTIGLLRAVPALEAVVSRSVV